MRKFKEILRGTWEGSTHRKEIFNILWNGEVYTFDPNDSYYFIFKNGDDFEVGYYVKVGRNFLLWHEEPNFYA